MDHPIFQPLPTEVIGSLQRDNGNTSFEKFSKFLRGNSVEDISFLSIKLGKPPKRPKKQMKVHRNKKLSLMKRKQLGLYKLGKTEIKYDTLLPIHSFWEDYMRQILNIESLKISGWNNSPDHPKFDQIGLKLFRADYHGAMLTVIKSSCPSLVGCSGIVAMETKNCFKLVGVDNICRTVPKKDCEFHFTLENFNFTFYGKNFAFRTTERSSKKIKLIRQPKI